jgi:hypothetical protein
MRMILLYLFNNKMSSITTESKKMELTTPPQLDCKERKNRQAYNRLKLFNTYGSRYFTEKKRTYSVPLNIIGKRHEYGTGRILAFSGGIKSPAVEKRKV